MEADFSDPERDLARLALTAPRGRHILGDPKPRAGCTTTLAARCASDRGRERGAWNAPGARRRRPYFFTFTNEGTAVGFFANHNHLAALEYALLPLGAAALAETQTPSPAFLVAILGAVASALLFALTLTASRSAMILGGLSAAATLAFVLTPELTVLGRRRSLALIAAFALALLPIAIGFGFLNIFIAVWKARSWLIFET